MKTTPTTAQIESLARAKNGGSLKNDALTLAQAEDFGFKGTIPRENVFGYNAWKGYGRTVRKGEKAQIRIMTWVPTKPKSGSTSTATDAETLAMLAGNKRGRLVPRFAFLFHVSQTHENGKPDGLEPVAPGLPWWKTKGPLTF